MSWSARDIPDQKGRTTVVTGGNGGLGLETVREMARRGAHVVMAARNMEKAARAEAELKGEIGGVSLEVRDLDLSSLASIEKFAQGVLHDHEVIDILFNNAGVMATPEWETEDGFEMQFGTNHLGHFALTAYLLPAVLSADQGRIVHTTSGARSFAGNYDLTNPHNRGSYDPWIAYGYSKRANVQFTLGLHQRLSEKGSNVRALAADPGFSNTDLQAASARNSGGGSSQRFFHVAVGLIGQSASKGALPQLRAGTDPKALGGTLYRPRWISVGAPVEGRIGRRVSDPADVALLWEVSQGETGIELDVARLVEEATA